MAQNAEKWGRSKAKEMVKGYASGGRVKKPAVNINIISAPSGPTPPAGPLPGRLPVPPPGPLPGPMGAPPAPTLPPGGMKTGGAVKMKAGSDSGEGRLEKKAAYGKRARGG